MQGWTATMLPCMWLRNMPIPTVPAGANMNRNDLRRLCAAPVLAAGLLAATAACATDCRTNGPNGTFEAWLARFKAEAVAQGVSRNAIAAASPYLVYDQRIINIDRGQRIFAQTLLEFSGRMLPAYRLQQGAAE